jgi:hypothetical protein
LKNLITAIITAFTAITGGVNNDFYNALGGRMFLDQAPEGSEFPYCVFMVVSATPDRPFGEYLSDALIQFSLFSTSDGAGEVADLYAYLKALYDNKSMTVTGNTLIWMLEQNLATMTDEVDTPSGTVGVKHWAVDYSILLEQI